MSATPTSPPRPSTLVAASAGRGLALPRETRDTWFMLAVIAWTVAPHLLRLSLAIGALCAGVLLWRGWLAWRQRPLPSRWVVLMVLALAGTLTWLSEHTLLGRDAGVTLLVVLMTLKTLELRARRDALVVFFLGFFLVLTQFLYSQGLLTALAMTLSVWGWLTALTLAHMPVGRPTLRAAGGVALWAAAVGTPVMVALFILFPRIGPLWALPGDQARSGLSDELTLGEVSQLARDDSIALRVRFPQGRPPAEQLYFRGPVLSRYDGEHWTALPARNALRHQQFEALPAPGQAPISYEVTVEPLRIGWLPLLEHTLAMPKGMPGAGLWPQNPDEAGQWRLAGPLGQRLRLEAQAWPRTQHGLTLPPTEHHDHVWVPSGLHMRTRAWAWALRRQPALKEATPDQLVQVVLSHIRNNPYSYTLSPGRDTGDPIDTFWLERRSGFCEHYAAAMVVILRALDIPARIVTGYQGTDPQPVDGYYIVRQSHAHAWVEYWQAGQGWRRTDPTAAVAPDRVMQSNALFMPPGGVMGMIGGVDPTLGLQLRQWFEMVDNRWNQWVLGYGSQQQDDVLDRLGFDTSDAWALARLTILLVAAAATGGALWVWWDLHRRSPWERLRRAVERVLHRLDVDTAPDDTPARWAHKLLRRRGPDAQPLADMLLELERVRYATDATVPVHRQTLARWQQRFLRASKALPLQGG